MKKGLFISLILALLLLAGCGTQGAATETPVLPTETAAPAGTAAPVVVDNSWLEELPWEETWTCLLLRFRELEDLRGEETVK